MDDAIKIETTGPVVGSIRPPGSKSITNRALVCAALADGTSVLQGALDSDDTRVMIAGLEQLGIAIRTEDAKTTLKVTGCGGKIPAKDADLSIGNSGTTMRFLTAMSTLGQGRFRLDGVPRMRERPIGDLLDALIPLGTNIATEFENGCPPVIVNATGLGGGMTTIRGDISSQYLSGLMMAAPYAQQPVHIVLDGPLVSKPYVAMTQSVMKSFGVSLEQTEKDLKIPAPQKYKGQHYAIEPDASAASYFWATAAITGGDVTVKGLQRSALQGDVRFCDCLAQWDVTSNTTNRPFGFAAAHSPASMST